MSVQRSTRIVNNKCIVDMKTDPKWKKRKKKREGGGIAG
jgi:hypothetical protein